MAAVSSSSVATPQKTGGYNCNFVEPVPSALTCPVCLLPFRDPHLLDCCSAKYCVSCISRVKTTGQPCPICKQPFNSIAEKNDQRRVLGLKVHCSNESCEWIGELRHLANHEREECEWVLLECFSHSRGNITRQIIKLICPANEVYNTLPFLVGAVISILVALLVHSLNGFLDRFPRVYKNHFYDVKILEHPDTQSCVIVWSLYICHQVFHWAMLFYARCYLKTSHKLRPFHYWMAGMNLFFVLLHLAQTHLTYDGLACSSNDVFLRAFFLSMLIHIAESDRRGLFFCNSFYSASSRLRNLAKEVIPFYFSMVILFSFWHHPLEGTPVLLSRLIFELVFIVYSCLTRTLLFENKYWLLSMELLILGFMTLLLDIPDFKMVVVPLLFTCQLVFVTSAMHKLPIRKNFKMAIDFVVIVCFCYVYTETGYSEGVPLIIFYYMNVILVTGLLLIINNFCKCL